MKQKKALLLDETQKERLDWMKHKVIDLIGGNIYRAIRLDETYIERLDWMKHNLSDLIGGNIYSVI